MKEKGVFQGFSKNTIGFLTELKQNNNKAWFEANRMRYQEHLLKPLVGLVTDLSGLMLSFDQYVEVSPAVGKTISRIYRDTRFSSDKSPFRNTIWITFKRPRKDWIDAPAYFFEISPESYRYGMGFYSAGKKTMDRVRQRISDDPAGFSKVISFYSRQHIFAIEGEKYKRVLNRNIPQELIDWYHGFDMQYRPQ